MLIDYNIQKIIFLGPEGTYCEGAKDIFLRHCGCENIEQKYFTSIKNVIEYTAQTPDSAAIVPVENSIEGVVRETMDNLVKIKDNELKITAETVMQINHCLISKTDDIKKVKKIVSYTQALAQCQNTLHQIFDSNFEFVESPSTAKAVKELIASDDTYAAIGSEIAAKKYGFNILQNKINDEPDNKTRFLLLSRHKTSPTNNDKTSIVFATKNETGSLLRVLKVFYDYEINLSYIDSRPSKKNLGEYLFYVDFEGHMEDVKSKKALELIYSNTNFVKILGSYTYI